MIGRACSYSPALEVWNQIQPLSRVRLSSKRSKIFFRSSKPVRILGSTSRPIWAPASIAGNATCNRYVASYKKDGKRIKVGEAGSTKMACLSPELAAQEEVYLAAIAGAETFKITGDTLRISYGDDRVLTFTQQPSTAIEGTDWVVTGYNNGTGGVVSILTGTKLTARFFDGGLAGSAGCNSYRAGYEVDGASIGITPAAATRKMCAQPDGIMEQEAQFLTAVSSAAEFRINGNTLEMRREDGALAVKLEARD